MSARSSSDAPARRWYGLPPQSPVLSSTPGSQTIISAGCGPVLAVPAHSDRTDGRHTLAAATPPTQQHVANPSRLRRHVLEERNVGAAYG